jgi:hypothetical protein
MFSCLLIVFTLFVFLVSSVFILILWQS